MIGGDNKLYLIGKSFNNNKLLKPTQLSTLNRDIKQIGVQSACIGDNFLVVLLMNGVLLSRHQNKDKDNVKIKPRTRSHSQRNQGHVHKEDEDNFFSEIRLNKEYKFRRYQNKLEAVKIQFITCYNLDGFARCIAVATNDEIYEWKAPSTNAYCVGHVNGIMDVACGPKLVLVSNTMGEVYGWGDNHILGLSSKERKLLKDNKYVPLRNIQQQKSTKGHKGKRE